MNILILDIYKSTDYRISKDTSGGYGTGNDFGDTFAAIYLKKKLKKIHDWHLYLRHILTQFLKKIMKLNTKNTSQKILKNMIYL